VVVVLEQNLGEINFFDLEKVNMTELVTKEHFETLTKRYSKNSISTHTQHESNLVPLSNSEKHFLREDQKELLEYAVNREWQTSKFKMRHFVGDAQVTPYAKLKQFIVEAREREEAIASMEFEKRKQEVEVKILKKKIEQEQDELQKELHQIELEKKERGQSLGIKRIEDLYKERQQFLELIDEFNNSPEGRLPDGTLLLECLSDPIKEEILERELWTARLAKQAAMEIATAGRIGSGNLDAIAMLDKNHQAEVLFLATDYGTRLESAMGFLRNEAVGQLNLAYKDKDVKLTEILSFTAQEKNYNNLLGHEKVKE
jgi:hypothetical protein